MNNSHHLRRLLASLGTALVCGPLMAATGGAQADAKAQYDRDMAACRSGQTTQDRAACMDEAKSAYAEARRGVLGDGMEVDTTAAMKRCESLTGDERTACIARMSGQGTTSGSVGAGGIYRELVTREKAPAKDAPMQRAPATGTSPATPSPADAAPKPKAP